jgi:hypothetical protein
MSHHLEQMRGGDIGHVEGRVLAQQDDVHLRKLDGFLRPEAVVVAALAAHLQRATPNPTCSPEPPTRPRGAGAVFVLDPRVPGSVDDAGAVVLGERGGDRVGRAVAAGDLDGDGLAYLGVGSASSDWASRGGAGLVYYAPLRGAVSASSAQATRYGGTADDDVGAAVAISPDLSGDGWGDLLLGGPGEDSGGDGAGSVYLFSGGGI